MVCIQILSDLHLESPQAYDMFAIPPQAPYLALLGDIGYAAKHGDMYCAFLRRQLEIFRVVFLVLGNHEPWHSDWGTARARMQDFEAKICGERNTAPEHEASIGDVTPLLGEFVLLDQTRYDFPVVTARGAVEERSDKGDRVTVLGCTLFSRVPQAEQNDISLGVQDFYKITDWTVADHTQRFEDDLAWLNGQVAALDKDEGGEEKGKRKVIIFTHHCPTLDPRTIDPRHRNSPIQAGFATELKDECCFKSPKISVWAFGHTHFNCDLDVQRGDAESGGAEEACIRLVANQRGYYSSQATGFDVGKVIEI
ncbi:hypothetical protein O1611_g6849 [Lasiodiplodia mahajangana]|uniref:Uncharacterized protein n=1 Tax=Lasiodiplodia mahajangana TaxID=1108764 RepID=A0ACC2JHM4_9PEZI|nr:hypothetical protein O1611_g6849 [Lasiodiplodia mahajangana]